MNDPTGSRQNLQAILMVPIVPTQFSQPPQRTTSYIVSGKTTYTFHYLALLSNKPVKTSRIIVADQRSDKRSACEIYQLPREKNSNL